MFVVNDTIAIFTVCENSTTFHIVESAGGLGGWACNEQDMT